MTTRLYLALTELASALREEYRSDHAYEIYGRGILLAASTAHHGIIRPTKPIEGLAEVLPGDTPSRDWGPA